MVIQGPRRLHSEGFGSGEPDPDRSAREAARRARTKVRRYSKANQISRLWTLTYAVEPENRREVVTNLQGFFRTLRRVHFDGRPFPYVWVIEAGAKRGRLHAHFGLGEFVPMAAVDRSWGRGFVHARRIRALDEERSSEAVVAGYLSKYVGKSMEDGPRARGENRYDVAQGFQPREVLLPASSEWDAVGQAVQLFGGERPSYVWGSDEVDDWKGPVTRVLMWEAA